MTISPQRRELRDRGGKLGHEAAALLRALDVALGDGKRVNISELAKLAPRVTDLRERIDQFEHDTNMLRRR